MRYLRLQRKSKIYVAAPSGVATGGPELLHQLVYHIRRDLGLDAYVYYYGREPRDSPIPDAYREYGTPYVRRIDDESANVLVVPEVFPALLLLRRYQRIQKAVWWLSVDNFFLSYLLHRRRWDPVLLAMRSLNKVWRLLARRPLWDLRDLLLPDDVLRLVGLGRSVLEGVGGAGVHLYQSEYARQFLELVGVEKALHLPDYIHPDFLRSELAEERRDDVVAYNPAKGLRFTEQIIRAAARLQVKVSFRPVSGLRRHEVVELLRRAKVYIDFGYHPGKDRLPREAAALGCCVLVGLRGSARHEKDVPIPSEFKFSVDNSSIPAIVAAIQLCMENYEGVRHRFDGYRRLIAQERSIFLERVRTVFGAGWKEESDGCGETECLDAAFGCRDGGSAERSRTPDQGLDGDSDSEGIKLARATRWGSA